MFPCCCVGYRSRPAKEESLASKRADVVGFMALFQMALHADAPGFVSMGASAIVSEAFVPAFKSHREEDCANGSGKVENRLGHFERFRLNVSVVIPSRPVHGGRTTTEIMRTSVPRSLNNRLRLDLSAVSLKSWDGDRSQSVWPCLEACHSFFERRITQNSAARLPLSREVVSQASETGL